MNGSDLLLLCNIGTPAVPVYQAIGCSTGATIDEASATIDVSCKDSRAQRVLNGRYSSSISIDTLFVPDNASYLALQAALRNGDLILIAREEYGVVVETADAKVDSLSSSFPDQDAATVSIGMTIDGFWQAVGS
jgi:predicted secreted protein